MMCSVHLLPSSGSSSSSSRTLAPTAVFALKFSPLSTTLFTFERPGKTDGTEVHKNVRAWSVESGEEVAGWHQKSQDDWSAPPHSLCERWPADVLGSQSSPPLNLTGSYPPALTFSSFLLLLPHVRPSDSRAMAHPFAVSSSRTPAPCPRVPPTLGPYRRIASQL